jgi:chromosome partitioning protein
VIGGAKPTLHKDMPELARDYEMVVIDGAPRVNDLGRSAIMASDLVLIPIQPSPYDAGPRPKSCSSCARLSSSRKI